MAVPETVSSADAQPSLVRVLLLGATLTLVGALLFAVMPGLVVQDTWLALVSGREVVRHGLPSVDQLTVLAAGRRWVDQQWLGQVVLYELHRLAGMRGVLALNALACMVGLGFPIWLAYRRGSSFVILVPAVLAAIAAAPWAFQVRTQSLALAFFGALLALLLSDPERRSRRTLLAIPLLCLWANVHGSVALGALLTSAYGLLSLIRRHVSLQTLALTVLPPLTLLASPYGLALVSYYRLMLVNPPFAGHNVEWQRTGVSALTAVFFAIVVITIGAFVRHRRRFSVLDSALLALTLVTAVEAVRGIVWFALAALAIVPPALSRTVTARRIGPRTAGAVLAAGAAIFIVSAASLASSVPRSPSSARTVALVAAQAKTNGLVFANDRYADWLLWEDPRLRGRIAYDVRFELLTARTVARLADFADYRGVRWAAPVAGYRVVVADTARIRRLAALHVVRVVFDDGSTGVAVSS